MSEPLFFRHACYTAKKMTSVTKGNAFFLFLESEKQVHLPAPLSKKSSFMPIYARKMALITVVNT